MSAENGGQVEWGWLLDAYELERQELICSRITGVASHTWDNNRDACDLMIAEHFFGVYYCVLVVAFLWVCRHCVFTVLLSRQPVFNLQVDPRLLMLRA
jgi:hypothetical protein